MLLDTPSYKKLFKHMIILNNSIKVEFFEGPKLVKDNLQKIEKSLDLFVCRRGVGAAIQTRVESMNVGLGRLFAVVVGIYHSV